MRRGTDLIQSILMMFLMIFQDREVRYSELRLCITIVMRQFCLSVTITVQKRQTVLLRAIYWTHRLFALGMHFFQESCKKTAHISSRDTGTLSAVTIDILIITFIYSKYYFYIFKILLLYIQKH